MSTCLQEFAPKTKARERRRSNIESARARRNPQSRELLASLLLTCLAAASAAGGGRSAAADRRPEKVEHCKGWHPILPLTLRGGGGVEAGAEDLGAGFDGIPPASEDPMGFLKNMPELKPGARYAGVGGYKDDGMNTYRAQAIRKDILDWDVDETALDNETLADPEVLLGNSPPVSFERDLEKHRPTETITIPPRPDAFKNMPLPQVNPADGFDFNMESDDADFAPRAAVDLSDGVALEGHIGEGGHVVRRTYVEDVDGSPMVPGAGGAGAGQGDDVGGQGGASIGGGLHRESRETLLNFLGGRTLVEQDIVVRDAYTGPRFKWEEGRGSTSKWNSPATAAGGGGVGTHGVGLGWGCDEREVVDENGEVWITSSPAIKVSKQVREIMENGRREDDGAQRGGLEDALGKFYAAHNSSNVGMCSEIARRFVGQETLLNAMLQRKYGSDLTSVGFEAGPQGGMGADADADASSHGGGSHQVDRMIAEEYVAAKERENQWKIHQENMQTIAKMSPEEISRAQEQITTQMSPEMIKLLTNRGKLRLETLKNATVSNFAPPLEKDGEFGMIGDKDGGEERVIWPSNLRGVPKAWLRGINDTFWEFFTSPDGPWVHVDEAEARIEKKAAIKKQELEQANIYANMIKLDPENVEAYNAAAKFARHVTKDKTLAMEYLQASVRLNPNDADALTQLGSIMSERGLPEHAQQLLEGALELDPSHAQAMCEYGRLCEASFNDQEAAYGMYVQALETNPGHLDSLVRLAGLLMSRGEDRGFDERFEYIEKLLLRAFEIDEKDPRVLAHYAALLHDKVLRTRSDDDADHAEGMYMRAIMADPSRVQALCGFGNFEMVVRRDAERAELLFRTALEYDTEHCETLCHYATMLGSIDGKSAAAEDMFRRAVRSDPVSADVLGEYSNFLYRGKKDELAAEAQYRHALSLNPGHVPTLNNFATMLLERAEPGEECSEAERLMFLALKLAPDDVDTILNCASLLWQVKRDQEASKQMCLRALQAQPDHVGALCHFAVLQLKMNGDAEAAMETIERARMIEPTNEFVVRGGEWFKAQLLQQRADKAAASRERACEDERTYRERVAAAGAGPEGGEGGGEDGEGAKDVRSPSVQGGVRSSGGALPRPAAAKREVEGPKQGPRYESLGTERLPDNMPDGTVLCDANLGCLVGNSAVAKTTDGYPGGGVPIGEKEVEEIFQGAVAAARQGVYTGGKMNAGNPNLAGNGNGNE